MLLFCLLHSFTAQNLTWSSHQLPVRPDCSFQSCPRCDGFYLATDPRLAVISLCCMCLLGWWVCCPDGPFTCRSVFLLLSDVFEFPDLFSFSCFCLSYVSVKKPAAVVILRGAALPQPSSRLPLLGPGQRAVLVILLLFCRQGGGCLRLPVWSLSCIFLRDKWRSQQ